MKGKEKRIVVLKKGFWRDMSGEKEQKKEVWREKLKEKGEPLRGDR